MKQVLIVRKDLNMRKGKMCSQVAHASVRTLEEHPDNPLMLEWLNTGMTKIVVGCNSEDELLQLYEQAKRTCDITALIRDAGKTEFDGPTLTVLAIGPDREHKIDSITKDLKLL
jgi:PTH2 family peptidyl-tRNA hydrolase